MVCPLLRVLTAPPPAEITITTMGSSIAGQAYTLTCVAVLIEGSTVTVDVQWLGSDGTPILDGEGVDIGTVVTEGVQFSRSLTFGALLASQAGEYMCQASFPDPQSSSDDISSNQTLIVTVQSELQYTVTSIHVPIHPWSPSLYTHTISPCIQFPHHLCLSLSHLNQYMKAYPQQ